MESSTKILRRLLDERGVEWTEPTDEYWELLGGIPTRNYVTIIGEKYVEEALDGTLVAYHLTPKQAIDATLGPGTCHDVALEGEWFECSECGTVKQLIHPHYCPNCGKRVVE